MQNQSFPLHMATALTCLGLLVAAAPPLPAQVVHAGVADGNLGDVDFQATCTPAVKSDVDTAVALLHHMMYEESRAAFEGILREDPACAAAHWGLATTLFQPLWPARPDAATRERGWDAVQRARALEPATPRERLLVNATAAFFQDPEADEWWPRIERWANALEEARREQPSDVEIAAFYGLSRLAAGQLAEDPLAWNQRAAEVLAEAHAREPLHPGLIHYTIHADDATGRASEHLHMVEQYGEIAPDVPHALHMPSHIYVRLGDWPAVIDWNRRSAEAALAYPAGNRTSLHHVHALDYLLYAHLQQGDDASASAVLEEAASTGPYQEDFASAFHLAIMPARFAVERRAWDEALDIRPNEPDYLAWDRYLWPQAVSWFARGLGAIHKGDVARAQEAEARLLHLREQAEAAGERTFAAYIEIDRLILHGRIAHAEGEIPTAIARLREAADLETTVEKHPITPGALLPPNEALGDLLLELDRPAEAGRAYERSLDIWPGRYHSLLGAARAARSEGQEHRAREHYRALLEVVGDAESSRPGVEEARAMSGWPG